ncbi:MAG: YegS/Rv2252/BmrU family lipid kinase [Actinomycetota bacterium]|nr:YegS/Rv2252/BmrU family lipid kinase [Actinomycetota bacterium]
MRAKAELQAAIRRHRRTVLVVNIRSRRGRRLYPAVRSQLVAAGVELLGSFPVDRPGQLAASLQAATDLQPDLVIVGGGDGSISQAARHLAYRDIALGLLPLGTTNNFARSLAIPLTLSDAIAVLTTGKVADVDLGHVGGLVFANLVSIGMSAQIARHVPAPLKRLIGRAAYPVTALACLPWHRPFHARVLIDGQVTEFDTHQLNIANGSFHAGRPITADATVDDRLLLVYPLGGHRRSQLISATIRHAIAGRYRTLAKEPFIPADEVWLDSTPSLPLDVDGEIHGHTPARITLAAAALRVMVDQDFPSA